jgi:sterol desaturase/sphingolipid hydroxylase (fatty acid hydroxylase superfamily)
MSLSLKAFVVGEGTGAKDALMNLVPPAMIAAVLAFWAYSPASLHDNAWTLIVVAPLITITVLLLEIVAERHAGWRMNMREFLTDLFYVVFGATVISWLSQTLGDGSLTAAKAALGFSTQWAGELPFLVQVALVIFIYEFGQYWMHRLMHNVTPLWLTHAPHHHLTQLNAAKGTVGNPIELFLISLSVIAVFDFDKTALFAGFNTLHVVSSFAHANVRSNPPIWYSFVFTTIRHHSLHHSTDYESTRCNYGNSLILLDRIFGTYREGEAAVVGQDELKRLSILEQWMFPFAPAVARYKARRAAAGGETGQDNTGSIAAA